MRLLFTFFATLCILSTQAQEPAWMDYDRHVPVENEAPIIQILDDYFSKPANIPTGITYNLYKMMFNGSSDVTHTFQVIGTIDDINEISHFTRNADFSLMLEKIRNHMDPRGRYAGKGDISMGTPNKDNIEFVILDHVENPAKRNAAALELWANTKPNNYRAIGAVISGREDGITHYTLVERTNLKELLGSNSTTKEESMAWEKYLKDRGEMKQIKTMTRKLAKSWN
jgi:hypothetical protein